MLGFGASLGLLKFALIGGVLLAAVGSLYECVYQEGAEDAEARNLRATIETGHEAQKGTRAAYARVSADLADEREQTAALRAQVDELSLAPAPPQSEADEVPEAGRCTWDSPLPWPPADAG